MRLSKSKYQSGLQCKKKLWLEINDSDKASPLSKAVERIFEQGTEVGIEARKRFSGGILIEYDRTNPSSSVDKTKDAIKGGAEVLFEGAFFYDDTLILADILTKIDSPYWGVIGGLQTDEKYNRVHALIEALQRIPDDMFEKFKDLSIDILWFLPEQHLFGRVFKCHAEIYPPENSDSMMSESPYSIVLYLSPELEYRAFDVVVGTAAHEIAHIVLGHLDWKPDSSSYEKQENEVWDTLRKWGFNKEVTKNLSSFKRIESMYDKYQSVNA